jgi:DNA-binding response OmpR family regulator
MKSILLIEDSNASSQNIIFNLEKKGYNIIATKTIHGGINLFKENRFGLIIINMSLKNERINNSTKDLENMNKLNSIPLIMLTNQEAISSLQDPGVNMNWLIKPFSADKLLKTVDKLFT